VSIGAVLANARRRAGLSVTWVSHRTRIRETIITGIEGDDYSACGGDFYARGHIRAIAAAVGADPEPLIELYDAARLGPQTLAGEATEPLTPLRMTQHRGPGPAAPAGMHQQRPPAGPVTPAGRRRRPRRPPAWAWALGVVLVAGLGVAGYLIAATGHAAAPSAGAHPATPRRAGKPSHAVSAAGGGQAAPAPAATTPAAAPPRTLAPASAAAFGSAGGQGDNSDLASRAIDGNPATAWHTDWYATARFGNLYPGTGLLVDMGRPVTITTAAVTLGRAHGARFQLRVGGAPALASLRPVARAAGASGGVIRLRLTRPARGRYVLLWFTRLPPGRSGTFQATVYGLHLQGR
jgi:helix-turn-helix protein